MNEKTKKNIKAGLLTTALLTTVVITGEYIYPEEQIPETDVEVTIEDKGQSHKEMRIVPKDKIPAFPGDSFTVNDIISEIEIEQRRGGDNDRVKELRNMLKKFEKEAKDVENARPPKVEETPVAEEPIHEEPGV